MTTILLNLHNAGFFELNSMILAMGIFYGGLAQVIAGIMESKKNNTFGMTAFTSYGFFWLSLVVLLLAPKFGWADEIPEGYMGWYFFMWGVFTAFMFVGTLKTNRVTQFVFFSLAVLFFLLAARDWTGLAAIGTLAGWEGIVCGSSAIYLAMAEALNEWMGRRYCRSAERRRRPKPCPRRGDLNDTLSNSSGL